MELLFDSLFSLAAPLLRFVVSSAGIGVVLFTLTFLAFRYIVRIDARSRYRVWWATLILTLALPVAPQISALVPKSMSHTLKSIATQPDSNVSVTGKTALRNSSVSASGHYSGNRLSEQVGAGSLSYEVPKQSGGIAPHRMQARPVTLAEKPAESAFTAMLYLIPPTFILIWLLTTFLLMTRTAIAAVKVVMLKKRALLAPGALRKRLTELAGTAGFRRDVRILVSEDINTPVAVGFFRPAILIPLDLSEKLGEHEMDMVVLHEIAHLERYDDWARLIQRLFSAVLFFFPSVLWTTRQIDLDREIACDNWVVRRTGHPRRYARCLARLIELTDWSAPPVLAPGAVTTNKQIFRRFESILTKKGVSVRALSKPGFVLFLVVVSFAGMAAAKVIPSLDFPNRTIGFDEISQAIASTIGTTSSRESNEAVPVYESAPTKIDPVKSFIDIEENDPGYLSDSDCEEPVVVVSGGETYVVSEPEGKVHWGREHRTTIGARDDVIVHKWKEGRDRFEVTIDGLIELSEDRLSIEHMPRNSRLEIFAKQDGKRIELEIASLGKDSLTYDYFIDNDKQEFDRSARRWLTRVFERLSDYYYDNGFVSVVPVGPAGRATAISVPSVSVGTLPTGRTRSSRSSASARAPRSPQYGKSSESGYSYNYNYNYNRGNRSVPEPDWNDFRHGTSISTDDGVMSFVWSRGRDRLKVVIDGEITLSEDDKEIESISPRGLLEISEKQGRERRELEIEATADDKLEYTYYVNGRRSDFDDEGREWLAEILPDIIRQTGIGAEGRVKKILERDGFNGVLDEIGNIRHDHVKRLYYDILLSGEPLDNEKLSRLFEHAADELESDYEKAELLIELADSYRGEDFPADVLVKAAATIDSDFETRRVLSEIGLQTDLDPETKRLLFEIAAGMDSDFEKAELLIELAPYDLSDPDVSREFERAIADIDSDFELRRVLSELGDSHDADPEFIVHLLKLVGRMDSDFEKAELLLYLDEISDAAHGFTEEFLDAASDIDSDYELRRVLSALEFSDVESDDLIMAVLQLAERMDSDYERAELLVRLSRRVSTNEQAVRAFIEASRSIESDFETARTLKSIMKRAEFSDDAVEYVLDIISDMSSDHEKSQLLRGLTDRCLGNDFLEDAYLDAVETLDSDFERDRLYSVFTRGKRSR